MSRDYIATLPNETKEALQEFIEKEGFKLLSADLEIFECAGGHIWHIDQILDHMNECLREKCL